MSQKRAKFYSLCVCRIKRKSPSLGVFSIIFNSETLLTVLHNTSSKISNRNCESSLVALLVGLRCIKSRRW